MKVLLSILILIQTINDYYNKYITIMTQNIWCKVFRLHKYEIIKEEDFTDMKGNVIGKVYISRCTHCGKIHRTVILTEATCNNYN